MAKLCVRSSDYPKSRAINNSFNICRTIGRRLFPFILSSTFFAVNSATAAKLEWH